MIFCFHIIEELPVVIQIRRLSTLPFTAISEDGLDFRTRWIWYLQDANNNWKSYDDIYFNKSENVKMAGSLSIEIAYSDLRKCSRLANKV